MIASNKRDNTDLAGREHKDNAGECIKYVWHHFISRPILVCSTLYQLNVGYCFTRYLLTI